MKPSFRWFRFADFRLCLNCYLQPQPNLPPNCCCRAFVGLFFSSHYVCFVSWGAACLVLREGRFSPILSCRSRWPRESSPSLRSTGSPSSSWAASRRRPSTTAARRCAADMYTTSCTQHKTRHRMFLETLIFCPPCFCCLGNFVSYTNPQYHLAKIACLVFLNNRACQFLLKVCLCMVPVAVSM